MAYLFKRMRVFRSFFAAAVAGTLIACGGGAGGTSSVAPVVAATQLVGQIQSSSGAPVAGATVAAAGQSTVTGSDGNFAFNLDTAVTSAVVLVKKPGFATNAKQVPLVSGNSTQANITLFTDQVNSTFNAAAAASIAVGSATVQIPANSLKWADGGDYTGTVTIGASYYSPDTAQGVQAFAGPYMGVDAGLASSIVSMGFMEVKLSDALGNPLQLKIGSPATLTFPASSNSASAATVPLWFYDETAKIWKREGQATLQSNGTYQGSVAHFTIWNADFFGISATLKGCFRDITGQPVTNVGFTGLRGTGWSHLISGRNPDGNFQINLVPANMPFELYSAVSPPTFAYETIPPLAAGEVRQLPCRLATFSTSNTIVQPATPFTTTPSVPAGTSTASFAGAYTGTYGGAEVGTFSVNINAAGVVSGSNFSQTYQQSFNVTGQVSAGGSLSLTAAGSAGSAVFGGSISPTGALTGTWRYVGGLTGSGTFSGQRN